MEVRDDEWTAFYYGLEMKLNSKQRVGGELRTSFDFNPIISAANYLLNPEIPTQHVWKLGPELIPPDW
jgi:hypothetical protein